MEDGCLLLQEFSNPVGLGIREVYVHGENTRGDQRY